jgi:hypothetical protein
MPRQRNDRSEALRASLVSATSLLALLLLEGREAVAGPIITVGTSVPFFTVLGSSFGPGIEAAGRSSVTETYTFTPLTTGAAATADGYTGFSPYFLNTASAANRVTINPGDSDLPALRRSGSVRRTEGASNSVFVGTGGGVALLALPPSMAAAASASFSYTIRAMGKDADAVSVPGSPGDDDPTGRDALPVPGETAAAPVRSVSPLEGSDGRPVGPDAWTSLASVLKQSGAGRFLPGIGQGASVFAGATTDRPAVSPASDGVVRAIRDEVAKALYLAVGQAPNETNRANIVSAAVKGIEMGPPDVSTFAIASVPAGVRVPIRVVGTGPGELASSLTIFTAEAAALGDADDTFAFFFDPGILQ